MNSSIGDLSSQELRRAAELKERIDALQNELNRLLGAPAPGRGRGAPRRKISAAGIARIRAAAKARWARARAARPAARAPKRKISPAGRARLSALARARWAKVKASGKKRL